jgi:pyruvate,water dikinase
MGKFDPVEWVADPQRRSDIYDARKQIKTQYTSQVKGLPGSAGQAEGRVRILNSPGEGDQIQPGEILVAITTNVGWTPIFPRAAAVVTDVGAPLSHAAIVARELGIPAVVGCFNATSVLKNGDFVRVDGGQGIVEILERAV